MAKNDLGKTRNFNQYVLITTSGLNSTAGTNPTASHKKEKKGCKKTGGNKKDGGSRMTRKSQSEPAWKTQPRPWITWVPELQPIIDQCIKVNKGPDQVISPQHTGTLHPRSATVVRTKEQEWMLFL